jgi:hypothetical protein
VSAPGRGLVVG